MRIQSTVFLPVLMVLAIGCENAGTTTDDADAPAAAAPDTDPNAARQAIDQLRNDWVAAAERDDAATVAGFYADDAVFIDAEGKVHEGRAAIQTTWVEALPASTDLKVTEKTFETVGDLAYETGEYTQTITTPDRKKMTASGAYLVVSRRQPDGSWKIVRHASAGAPPTAN